MIHEHRDECNTDDRQERNSVKRISVDEHCANNGEHGDRYQQSEDPQVIVRDATDYRLGTDLIGSYPDKATQCTRCTHIQQRHRRLGEENHIGRESEIKRFAAEPINIEKATLNPVAYRKPGSVTSSNA